MVGSAVVLAFVLHLRSSKPEAPHRTSTVQIAQTRLEKRATRPNVELVRDTAQHKLVR